MGKAAPERPGSEDVDLCGRGGYAKTKQPKTATHEAPLVISPELIPGIQTSSASVNHTL
jgi:hypothetical protein